MRICKGSVLHVKPVSRASCQLKIARQPTRRQATNWINNVATPHNETLKVISEEAFPQLKIPIASSDSEQPAETGVIPEVDQKTLNSKHTSTTAKKKATHNDDSLLATATGIAVDEEAGVAAAIAPAILETQREPIMGAAGTLVYPPDERSRIRSSWNQLMRWSRMGRTKEKAADDRAGLEKVVVFGGGAFGTAMAAALARENPWLHVTLLLRDPYLCRDINEYHINTRYLSNWKLPDNVRATTSAPEAIAGAQYAIHAVPVQHTRTFLQGIRDILPPKLPLISVSKGLEVSTGQCMSDLIPSALGRKQPSAFLSGPSFAAEVMEGRPTGIVAASKDRKLARKIQQLFASPSMRVNTSTDVIGVEICGALKNVLAIAAGIVEGLDLGNNAMAALVAQGCAEIRWLAEKMGAKTATISGLSGLGDIMLTCYGSLSRNRSVGVRLGQGEALADILSTSPGVAEGVATAGSVVKLARKYRVQLPVLTAVAQVLDGNISAREAVLEIMRLPQIEER